jgi:hypothetical protein
MHGSVAARTAGDGSLVVPHVKHLPLLFLALLSACGESRNVSDYERIQAEAAREAAREAAAPDGE